MCVFFVYRPFFFSLLFPHWLSSVASALIYFFLNGVKNTMLGAWYSFFPGGRSSPVWFCLLLIISELCCIAASLCDTLVKQCSKKTCDFLYASTCHKTVFRSANNLFSPHFFFLICFLNLRPPCLFKTSVEGVTTWHSLCGCRGGVPEAKGCARNLSTLASEQQP